MVDEVSVPSPDLTDPTTLMTNFGATLASDNITPSPNSPDMARSLTTGKVHGTSSDISSTKPLGHQSGIKTGGTEKQDKVLWCNNLDLSYNYRKLFELLRKFGPIERMKVVLTDKSHLSAFVTFFSNLSAKKAKDEMITRDDMDSFSFSILCSKNVLDEDTDYIPDVHFDDIPSTTIIREQPLPSWYVAYYNKDNKGNSIKALQYLETSVNTIPKENFKKYGKAVLVKAKNDVQSVMLLKLQPSAEDIIASVKPHPTFNHTKGVIYSSELHDFTEKEILDLCPDNVYNVKKMKGTNNALVLSFSTKCLPDYVNIRHLTFKVRKYKLRPKQCFNCFRYGHFNSVCESRKKCFKCSVELDDPEAEHYCSVFYCCNCKGNHSPQSQICPYFCFERDIVETAHNEYISYGRAKAKMMGANKNPDSTYASVVTQVKLNETRNPQHQENSHEIAQHSQSTPAALENNAPQHTVHARHHIQTCIKTPEECSVTPSTSKGFGKIRATPDINIYNKYAALASLEDDDDDNIVPVKYDKITDASPLEKRTGGKRRGQGNGTPPKPKKPNTAEEHILPYLENKDIMEVQINSNEIEKAPQPLLQHEPDITQFDPEHQAIEAKVKEPSMNNKSYIEVITPSPIIGKTGKSLMHPKTLSPEVESRPQASSVLMDSSVNIVDTNKSHTLPHKPSCGCHQCFVDKLADIKEMSPRSCSILIDNFIKYKAKNQYGDLEEHTKDCLCVDHLMKIRTSDSLAIPNLLEKIKQKQGAIPKRLINKLNTKNPIVQQKFVSTKVSRHNVLLDRTQSTK